MNVLNGTVATPSTPIFRVETNCLRRGFVFYFVAKYDETVTSEHAI